MKRVLLFVLTLLLVGSTTLHAQSPQKITVGTVTFELAPDYKEEGRMSLSDGSEVCLILLKGSKTRDRLVLKINPKQLRNVNGLTDDEIKKILFKYVHGNTQIFYDKVRLDQKFKILYNNNADGTYFPHCYNYISWKEKNGTQYFNYSEAALVNRIIVCGSVITADKAEFQGLREVFSDVVAAANQ